MQEKGKHLIKIILSVKKKKTEKYLKVLPLTG